MSLLSGCARNLSAIVQLLMFSVYICGNGKISSRARYYCRLTNPH